MKNPKVSVITVNYNGGQYLRKFFSSLEKQSYKNIEVIAFDNNSKDKSPVFIKKFFPKVKLIKSNKNLGFCLANNKAANLATGKYIFFLNNDTWIKNDTISLLVGKMEKDSQLGIAGTRIMNYDGSANYHTGIGIDVFGYPVLFRKQFYVEGSALMIKKNLFDSISGFDPKYFMFHEDVDLCWRIRLKGYKIKSFNEPIVYHFAGAVAGGGERVKKKYRSSYLRRYYSERNGIRTLLKNYHLLLLTLILPLLILINVVEMIFFTIIMGDIKIPVLYFKSYAWNILNIKDTLKQRRIAQETRKISDIAILKNMFLGSGKLIALFKTGIPEFS